MNDIHQIRKNYMQGKLIESDLNENPIQTFRKWLEEAISSNCIEPTAMTLSTVSAEGKPSGRILLLKDVTTSDAFVFFTNYESRKGNELQVNSYASLTFFWAELERQVRIIGRVEQTTEEMSDKYFYSRPSESQLAACISPQSRIIPNREWLDEQFSNFSEQHNNINRPKHWGGYQLFPEEIEFWQGRANRLHDRIQYIKHDELWIKNRLAP